MRRVVQDWDTSDNSLEESRFDEVELYAASAFDSSPNSVTLNWNARLSNSSPLDLDLLLDSENEQEKLFNTPPVLTSSAYSYMYDIDKFKDCVESCHPPSQYSVISGPTITFAYEYMNDIDDFMSKEASYSLYNIDDFKPVGGRGLCCI